MHDAQQMQAIEARILGVERMQMRADDDLRRLKRRVIGIGQEVWDTDVSFSTLPPPIPPVPSTNDFLAICPVPVPLTLTLHSAYWGLACTMTYQGSVSKKWTGCFVVPYPGDGVCPAANTPVFWNLQGSTASTAWVLTYDWISHSVGLNQCTLAATCGGTANRFGAANVAPVAAKCPPHNATWQFTGAVIPGQPRAPYPNAAAETITFT